jgi:Protein of unknown function (DUF3662)/FHA domain
MLARFERLMEQAVEGSLRRIFPTTLQPVQLAKAAGRAMEENRVVGLRGAEVPNVYRLRLSAADLERFGGYSEQLCRDLATYLNEYARERGVRPIAPPSVELIGDPRLGPGRVLAEAHFVAGSPEQRAEVEAARESTRQLRLAELAAAQPRQQSRRADEVVWLTDRGELRYALQPDSGLVRLGRAADNDLVIAQQRVSRYHAQLRRLESTWLVYDLESTNGTFVDGERVEAGRPRALGAARVLRLGDFDLYVAAGPPPA